LYRSATSKSVSDDFQTNEELETIKRIVAVQNNMVTICNRDIVLATRIVARIADA